MTSRATLVFIGLNLVGFIIELAMGANFMNPTPASLIAVGGDFAPLTLAGEPWRLVTSMFLHGGLIHLAMNMYCLYQVRAAERLFGASAYSVIYMVAGLAGALLSLTRPEPAVSVGASGALFGIFGAYFAVLIKNRARLERDAFMQQMRSLGGFLAINLVIGLSVPMINMRAHIGGLVGGALAGLVAMSGRPGPQRRTRVGVLAVAALLLTTTAVLAWPAPTDFNDIAQEMSRTYVDQERLFNKAWEAYEAGTATAAETRRVIGDEVLPAWRATAKKLAAVEDAPSRVAPMLAAASAYFDARASLWELLAEVAGHENEPAFVERTARLTETLKAWKQADDDFRRESDKLRGESPAE